jgi:hypothetical protein
LVYPLEQSFGRSRLAAELVAAMPFRSQRSEFAFLALDLTFCVLRA